MIFEAEYATDGRWQADIVFFKGHPRTYAAALAALIPKLTGVRHGRYKMVLVVVCRVSESGDERNWDLRVVCDGGGSIRAEDRD